MDCAAPPRQEGGGVFFEGDRPLKPTPTNFYTRGEFSKRGGYPLGVTFSVTIYELPNTYLKNIRVKSA